MKHNTRNPLLLTAACLFLLLFNVTRTSAQVAAQLPSSELRQSLGAAGLHIDSVMTSDFYTEKYLCKVTEPIDWKSPKKGTFSQRVIIMHRGFDRPTVVETEGYGAGYSLNRRYVEELSKILDANLVFVEHRYFLESTPDAEHFDWKYMTAENSAKDLHHVVTMMKNVYKGKWIASGISKGGQTALIYRAFFPDDVDISVPYVAPLCRAREDGRHESFIADSAGTPEARAKVLAFQREILKRRATIQPMFDKYCNDKGYVFKMSLPEALDYTVLEFSFSFWQWGYPAFTIPENTASDEELLNYLLMVDEPGYFAEGGDTSPFNYQAAHELGYYGYDLSQFKDLTVVQDTKDYYTKYMMPKGAENVKFDTRLYKKLYKFLETTDAKMMFIYGEWDPWSAVKVPDFHKDNIKIFIEPGGSHRSRIYTMPLEMRVEAVDTLEKWLEE